MFPKNKRLLSPSWRPTANTVLIAKGKAGKRNPGNALYRKLVEENLEKYSRCEGRRERAVIILSIMNAIAAVNPQGPPFVKFDGHEFWEADSTTIRENVSAAFRNRLADKYRSSAKSKSAARRERKKALKGQGSSASLKEEVLNKTASSEVVGSSSSTKEVPVPEASASSVLPEFLPSSTLSVVSDDGSTPAAVSFEFEGMPELPKAPVFAESLGSLHSLMAAGMKSSLPPVPVSPEASQRPTLQRPVMPMRNSILWHHFDDEDLLMDPVDRSVFDSVSFMMV